MRSSIISETWLTHLRISLFMYIWAYIFWSPFWLYFLMINGASIIDSFPCWPKLNVMSVHTQALVSILWLQSHSRPLCHESFGSTAQWELTTLAQSHFVVELLSHLKMIILVFTDQILVIFCKQFHAVMQNSSILSNLVGNLVLYSIWLRHWLYDRWAYIAQNRSMFILCWLTSSHLSGHDVDSLDISNLLALLVFRCCDFVFFIFHVPTAVWSDCSLFFWCNYHPRLLGCSSKKETHSR